MKTAPPHSRAKMKLIKGPYSASSGMGRQGVELGLGIGQHPAIHRDRAAGAEILPDTAAQPAMDLSPVRRRRQTLALRPKDRIHQRLFGQAELRTALTRHADATHV